MINTFSFKCIFKVSERQLNTIQQYVESGQKEGARLLVGGKRIGDKGYFFEPTVFADVTEDMRIGKEEVCNLLK